MITVKCENCDKIFNVCPKRFATRNKFFCSKKCEGWYRQNNCTTKIIAKCVVCEKRLTLKKSEFERRNKLGQITCSKQCLGHLREETCSGRKNPNCKYTTLDDNFFSAIDTEEKAYILGWIASDGAVGKTFISIEINKRDIDVLEKIKDVICKELPIVPHKNTDLVGLRICSKQIVKDVCNLLQIPPGKKAAIVSMPDLQPPLTNHFLRGLFDGDGSVSFRKNGSPRCSISSSSDKMKTTIKSFIGNGYIGKVAIEWERSNCIAFLNAIYSDCSIFLNRKYDKYKIVINNEASNVYPTRR
jgi:hypothetical protein